MTPGCDTCGTSDSKEVLGHRVLEEGFVVLEEGDARSELEGALGPDFGVEHPRRVGS